MSEQLELDDAASGWVWDADQSEAIWMLAHCRAGVVTGGPGKGKTACLLAALPYLGDVALCAPSGKAARRMAELTRSPASTVHRLLGLTPDAPRGAFHAGNPLPYDTVVIDEASTLDVSLGSLLLEACDVERTRVFFIGDVDQLPSVGPGQVLHDIIESKRLPVIRLKTMHRAAAKSWVCRMAPEILKGRIDLQECEDFEMVDAEEDLVESTVDVAKQLIAKYGRENVQVVTPMNVGEFGTAKLNPALQEVINPFDGSAYFVGGGMKLHAGDDVVCINNDYDRAVFNGETGRVVYVGEGRDGIVQVDYVDRVITYPTRSEAASALRASYALSVHKMQGSECAWIVLALNDQHGPLLSRKLLYTAVTRAKVGVVLVGQRSAVYKACGLADATVRRTFLRQRIEELALE
jgi:exodeoxyribonuclease V alpha subunit